MDRATPKDLRRDLPKDLPEDLIVPAPEVEAALASGGPVVALESTIITHGMPFPANVETARAVEAAVRAGGAVPATIAVVDGTLRIGIADDILERLGRAEGVAKASRRDLGPLLAAGATAGTTVAATMRAAALAGIEVFATGGIGGVHRGAAESFDISADLLELAVSPVTVVCAGAKSILDLPRTLEVLETQGVPVLGFGSDAFPAFFTRDSGLRLEHAVDGVAALAAIVTTHRRLGLPGGILVCNPIPAADALPEAEIAAHIDAALAEAAASGIAQKAVTPFLLGRIAALTGGRSLAANIALVKNNAALAAALAVRLAGTAAG